jgi:hypothetical protein
MSQDTLNIIIATVILPLLTVLVGYVVAFIGKKSKEIQENTQSAIAKKYIDFAEKTVIQVVDKIFQTYVDTLKDKGEWNEETAQIAYSMAKMEVLKLLTTQARDAITMMYSDLDAWLETQIEYNVKVIKIATTTTTTISSVPATTTTTTTADSTVTP